MPKHRWILFLIDVQREGQPLRILGHYLSLMLGSTGKGSRLLDCLILLCYVSKETVTWKNRHWRQNYGFYFFSSVQFISVTQSCPTLCDPMNRSMPGLPVHHQLLEFTQIHVHRVRDAIQPSHPLLSPSPPAPNPSQHQSLFQRVNSSHEVAKVLEFQL